MTIPFLVFLYVFDFYFVHRVLFLLNLENCLSHFLCFKKVGYLYQDWDLHGGYKTIKLSLFNTKLVLYIMILY